MGSVSALIPCGSRMTTPKMEDNMIRKKQVTERVIDLTGPDGNAMSLIVRARQWARECGKDASAITKEMTSGDYENLIAVFDREFGSFCVLER